MLGIHVGYLYTAHRYVLAIETLLHEVDLHAEMIVSLVHDAMKETLLNILELNGITPSSAHNATSLFQQIINNGCFDARKDDFRHVIMITQYATAVNNSDIPDIGRFEAIKAMEYYNNTADLIEYNGYSVVRIRIPRNFDTDENQRQHISRNDLNLSPTLLNRVVNSIVEIVPTDSIYIFGSYSRLEETRASDVDIYIVMANQKTDTGYDVDAMVQVQAALEWWDKPKDILCLPREQFDNKAQVKFSLEQKVTMKGIKIYDCKS